ncbi:MAG: hypothetical protein ACR2IR_09000 [Acidimicrobiia bacterium]
MRRLLVIMLMLLVAAAACSDDDGDDGESNGDDSTTAAGNEACELFSDDDAEEVLGAPVEKETDLGGTEATSCSYVAADDPTRVLGLGVGDLETTDAAEKALLEARADAQFDGLEVQQIDDIGDEAYYLPASNNFERTISNEQLTFGELGARDGKRVATAFVTPANEDAARAIVELALG